MQGTPIYVGGTPAPPFYRLLIGFCFINSRLIWRQEADNKFGRGVCVCGGGQFPRVNGGFGGCPRASPERDQSKFVAPNKWTSHETNVLERLIQ